MQQNMVPRTAQILRNATVELVAWSQENGLQSTSDFYFAFTSSEEAETMGGPFIQKCWEQVKARVDKGILRTASSSTVAKLLQPLPVFRPGAAIAKPPPLPAPKPLTIQAQRKRKVCHRSDAKDQELRLSNATLLVDIALQCSQSSPQGRPSANWK